MEVIKFRTLKDGVWYYATLDEILSYLGSEIIADDNVWAFADQGLDIGETNRPRCQYTGLEDKNDKEIYKGDIVKYSFIVETDEGLETKEGIGEIRISPRMGVYIYHGRGVSHVGKKTLEVIGNIYENPELLKQ